jgi:hypothetical protein
MHPQPKPLPLRALAGHFAMGAVLGAALALLLIGTGAGAFATIAHGAGTGSTAAILVGTFAAIFAVGATLTGWMFLAIEDA